MRTALRMVREEQGPDAVILSNRPCEGGIEIVAATDYDEALVQQALRAAAPALEPVQAPVAQAAPVVQIAQARAATPVAPRTPVVEVAEATPASRADAMIAALTGSARTLAQRVRSSERVTAPVEPAPPALPMAAPP